jgi:ATP-binding cassette subfamily B protein
MTTMARDGWTSMARLLLRSDWPAVALAVSLAVGDTALALAAPWPLKIVVDYALGRQAFPGWLGWLHAAGPVTVAVAAAAAGLLLLLAGALASYQATVLTARVEEQMTARLRTAVMDHVLRTQPRSAAAFPLGELTSRLGGDAVRVSSTIIAAVDTFVPEAVLLAGMTAITAVLDWRLTLIAGGIIPLYALTARFRNRRLRSAQQRARARSGELAALAAELLARLPAVHLFDRADDEAALYRGASARAAAAEVDAVNAAARFAPATDVLPGLGLAAALITGTVEVTSGRLTLGAFLVFLAYLSSLTGPVRSLARLSATIARGTASRDRIAELLRLPLLHPADDITPPAAKQTGTAAHGPTRPTAPRLAPVPARRRREPGITLDRVSYAHRPGHPVLDSATLAVPAAALTALTGPSGTGKSTLLALIVRLADPQSGRIRIGDHDIASLPLPHLRNLITLVPQDPWLHAGTIAENIAYGRPQATSRQIRHAAEQAGVAEFASCLPDGYDTPVGAHGRQLSGGQQRRVAIARALLRDTPALLLDEPTAGLDPAGEARLVTELLKITQDKTVILVTHQPALIARADHVLHLDGGRLTQAGPRPPSVPASVRAASS